MLWFTLSGDIRTLYLGCGYESAIFETSPWCQLLDEEDMIVQEYLGDLKVCNVDSYGRKM